MTPKGGSHDEHDEHDRPVDDGFYDVDFRKTYTVDDYDATLLNG